MPDGGFTSLTVSRSVLWKRVAKFARRIEEASWTASH